MELEERPVAPFTTELELAGSPFPPIAEYGFLSDCEVTALVAPSGNVEWMCVPRMDGPSIFAAILDRDGGHFRLGPHGLHVPSERRYLPGTMILETTWGTPHGWLVVRDVLLIGPWRHKEERAARHRRPPSDWEAEHVLLRTLRCVEGTVEVVLDCEPAFDYASRRPAWRYLGPDYHDAAAEAEGSETRVRLTTDLRIGIEGPHARARTTMREGDQAFCALSWSEHDPPRTYEEAHARLERTADYWHEWLSRGSFPDHPWRRYLERSALTLKGLTYAPTGALLAAATTSLPETPGGERNWDYRFTWIRDSTFTLWALHTLGYLWEANDFFTFVIDRGIEDPEVQIMFGIDGERDLNERVLDHLSGYEGARPVRVGNGAWDQRQHDVWGAVLDSVYLHVPSRDRINERAWLLIQRQVEDALAHWREPDRGIWEVRGEPKHFTASKVFCWLAADRGARFARLRGDRATAERWQAAADEIHADVCEHGVDGRGAFCQHYGATALDASCLLIPLFGFLPPDDPRVRATVLAIADELTVDELVLRYHVEETDDGLEGEEGSFTICSFWLVSTLTMIGEVERARRLCEKLLAHASPLLLYAEEIDAHTGRHLGNFPQAFSHLALVHAVMKLIEVDGRLERRGS
ncbi:MAG: glycoside hydrolase family 15 protein [Candidatus Dormibacteraeota bacterium]|nr:glycoside hydrolase family 15 protein [Candidatus Dormibacteraeota bacterium]